MLPAGHYRPEALGPPRGSAAARQEGWRGDGSSPRCGVKGLPGVPGVGGRGWEGPCSPRMGLYRVRVLRSRCMGEGDAGVGVLEIGAQDERVP